jgi:peptidoglycan/LPS O-acetylase OafA/YrhL
VPIAWTLSIELQFYLAAPFIVRRPLWICGAILAALLAVRMSLLGLDYHWRYFFAPSVWCFFMLGVVAHRLSGQIANEALVRQIGFGSLVALPVIGYLSGVIQVRDLDRPKLWVFYLFFATSIPFIFALTKSWRFDGLIGEFSYPIYLAHLLVALVIGWANGAIFRYLPIFRATELMIVATILASIALLFFIDRPIDALRARLTTAGLRTAAA